MLTWVRQNFTQTAVIVFATVSVMLALFVVLTPPVEPQYPTRAEVAPPPARAAEPAAAEEAAPLTEVKTEESSLGGVIAVCPPELGAIASRRAAWPTTPEEASATFGGDASRWEPTADPGGWHLREEPFRTSISPSGYVLEGYYDTRPGKDPCQFVSAGTVSVQGATIWRDASAAELFCAMVGQKYQDLPYDLVKDQIHAVGFTKPDNCG